MRKVYFSELRDSWPAWVGVSFGLFVTNTALALSLLVGVSGWTARQNGTLDRMNATVFLLNAGVNLVGCGIIGMIVVSSAVSLVVDSRRGSVARLLLAGASPRQVQRSLLAQLAAVSLACSVLANVVAALCLKPALAYVAGDRASDGVTSPPAAVWSPLAFVVASVVCVAVALLGGRRQALRASDIPPVEALRQAASGRRERMTVGRWIGTAVTLLVLGGLIVGLRANLRNSPKDFIMNIMQFSLVSLMVGGALVALTAPIVVAPLTRAWTALVPKRFVTWSLARSMVIARADRMSKSVVPVAMAIGITFGNLVIGQTINATLNANGLGIHLEKTGPTTFLIMLGLPLAVAIAGGVGVLIMMSKQRDAELALSGIVGTTPRQRVLLPTLEGAILTGTGALMGAFMAGVMLGYLYLGFSMSPLTFGYSANPASFLVPTLVSGATVVLATTLPTLPALRLPEPKVIARLVAE